MLSLQDKFSAHHHLICICSLVYVALLYQIKKFPFIPHFLGKFWTALSYTKYTSALQRWQHDFSQCLGICWLVDYQCSPTLNSWDKTTYVMMYSPFHISVLNIFPEFLHMWFWEIDLWYFFFIMPSLWYSIKLVLSSNEIKSIATFYSLEVFVEDWGLFILKYIESYLNQMWGHLPSESIF